MVLPMPGQELLWDSRLLMPKLPWNSRGPIYLEVTNRNGCASSDNIVITEDRVDPLIDPLVPPDVITCALPAVEINASSPTPGVNFAWEDPNGGILTGPMQTVAISGTFVLTVTNPANGCTDTSNLQVDEDKQTPVVSQVLSDTTTLSCFNETIGLTATVSQTASETYTWSRTAGFFANGLQTTASEPDTYTLTVENSNGCVGINSIVIDENKLFPVISEVQSDTTTLTCFNETITISAIVSDTENERYRWSRPAGFFFEGLSTDITEPDTYTLLVKNDNGCATTGSIMIDENKLVPVISEVQSDTTTLTCFNETILLSAIVSDTENERYRWSRPSGFFSEGPTATVTEPDTYTLLLKNDNGCSTMGSIVIDENKLLPVISEVQADTSTLTCFNETITITAVVSQTENERYRWSRPAGLFVEGLSADVTEPDTYTLLVKNDNGCSASESILIDENKLFPVISEVQADTTTLTCFNETITISAIVSDTENERYRWSRPAGFFFEGLEASITEPDTYTLLVKNDNGCSTTGSIVIDENKLVPVISEVQSDTTTLTCFNETILLTAIVSDTENERYRWSRPAGFFSEGPNAAVTEPDTYTLLLKNDNGCATTGSIVIDENKLLPVISEVQADTSTLTCFNETITITAVVSQTENERYRWSRPAGLFVEGLSADVTEPDTYTLLVKNDNGCSASESILIDENKLFPVISEVQADTTTLTCFNETITISAIVSDTENERYRWSRPAGFFFEGLEASITEPDTYTLLVKNDNGCSTTGSIVIDENKLVPVISEVQSDTTTLTCFNETILLTAIVSDTENERYRWSRPAGFFSEGPNAAVTEPDTYTLLLKNDNGCSTTGSIVIDENKLLPVISEVQSDTTTLTCFNETITITAVVTQTENERYRWSRPAGFFVEGLSADVTEPDTYTLLVKNDNGCSTTGSIVIDENKLFPVISEVQSDTTTLTCFNETITLTAIVSDTENERYRWSRSAGFFFEGLEAAVTEPDTYTLLVKNDNGCSTSGSIEIDLNKVFPEITQMSSDTTTLTCRNKVITLSTTVVQTANARYRWSRPSGFFFEGPTAEVDQPDTYTLFVKNDNGCSDTDSIAIDQDVAVPTIQLTLADPQFLNCRDRILDISLETSVDSDSAAFAWVGPNAFEAETQNIAVEDSGSYAVTVLDLRNGCDDTDAIQVELDTIPPTLLAMDGLITLANNQEYELKAQPDNSQFSYVWEGPDGFTSNEADTIATEAGDYSIVVTDEGNGCMSRDTVRVDVFDLALRKRATDFRPWVAGQDVEYQIELFNQGTLGVDSVVLVNHLPKGLELSPNDPNGWEPIGNTAKLFQPLTLNPDTFARLNIVLRVNKALTDSATVTDTLEIAFAADENGIDRTLEDFDSTADEDPDNEQAIIDNDIEGNPLGQGNQDEDDHDITPIKVEIFDLALKKTYDQLRPVFDGSELEFALTLYNQGTIEVDNIELIDYLPEGSQLSTNDNNGWEAGADPTATVTLDQVIEPGDSVSLNILIELDNVGALAQLTNRAEILSARPALLLSGPEAVFFNDFDATFDNDPDNDPVIDNAVTDAADEDDHDIALFAICNTVVSTFENLGVNSLRYALECANLRPGPDSIVYDLPGDFPYVFTPVDSLPTLYGEGTIFDGMERGNVILDGSELQPNSYLLAITGDAVEIRNLVLRNSEAGGIHMDDANSVKIINTNLSGTGNGTGIQIISGVKAVIEADSLSNFEKGINVVSGIEGSIFANAIFDNETGIEVQGSQYQISENSIYCNDSIGISLAGVGNNNQVFPMLETATPELLGGMANPGDLIELFVSDTTGCGGAPCQGKTFIGNATADEAGMWSLERTNIPGTIITGTATDTLGNTSEFANECITVCDFPIVMVNDTFLCNTAPIQIDAGMYPDGASFSWSNGASDQLVEFTAAGDYTLTVTLAEGCERSVDFNVRDELLAISTSPDTIILGPNLGGGTAQLEVFKEDITTGELTYSWSPTDGLDFPTIANPKASPTTTTTYLVTATNEVGCSVEDEITVEVTNNPTKNLLTIPEYFSPNGDGINDLWEITNIDLFPNSGLTIIDRWGSVVYEVNNYQNTWNGKLRGQSGGRDLPPGTYLYVLKLNSPGVNAESEFCKGSITIIR